MIMSSTLTRFTEAQEYIYDQALSEIKEGKKQSHWMWFIFPQIAGLGYSETTRFYAIINKSEAKEFLEHPILGTRLREITNELLNLDQNDAKAIFGKPDDKKLQSCMTLFSQVSDQNDPFHKVLDKFFNGQADQRTLEILENE
jgi:uncharacterized protein (DUF1810 family)